ncbi:hypothetical protein ANN_26309 [Periplaneta americana]|uniref:Histone-lysine N-methyltransferase SETMAR n=1 Tax=Periplaneta americana TaxID=6978 RepID=A0ABQ8S633_PERAM|nr:hypothetical protein ANN_26309 [Periplaneta americana]
MLTVTLRKLRRAIQNKRRGMLTAGVVLLHDNARPHTARRTTAVLTEFGWELFDHPPCSPDLAPSDFHVFLHLKKFLSSGGPMRARGAVLNRSQSSPASSPATRRRISSRTASPRHANMSKESKLPITDRCKMQSPDRMVNSCNMTSSNMVSSIIEGEETLMTRSLDPSLLYTSASNNQDANNSDQSDGSSPQLVVEDCVGGDNAGEMSPGSSTESYPAFARIALRENPGKNLNQVTCPDRDSNLGHLVSQPDALTVTPQVWYIFDYIKYSPLGVEDGVMGSSCPLQTATKLVPVPESLMSPDYRPAMSAGMTGRGVRPKSAILSSTPSRRPVPRGSPKLSRSLHSSPLLSRQRGGQPKQCQIAIARRRASPQRMGPQEMTQVNSSEDEDSEMSASKLETIRHRAQERWQRKEATSNNTGSNSSDVAGFEIPGNSKLPILLSAHSSFSKSVMRQWENQFREGRERQIGAECHIGLATVNSFIKRYRETGSITPQKKGNCGRKRKTSPADDRLIVRKS